MRRKLIAGNWKMNLTSQEAYRLACELKNNIGSYDRVDTVICPPFTALASAREAISGSRIKLGAQNIHWEQKGAYTGEISPAMLKDSGCEYVIIGHSERRHIMKETDQMINKKIRAAIKNGLTPILCIGELLEERERGITFEVVANQLDRAIEGLSFGDIAKIVIAYEPVWAIGTGKTATPQQAQEVQSFIRGILERLIQKDLSASMKILYGGSVTPENIKGLMQMPDLDGALVGGASLKADSFTKIVKFEE
jgi:triosephosphate isomerase